MPIIGYETDIFTFGYAYDNGLSAISPVSEEKLISQANILMKATKKN